MSQICLRNNKNDSDPKGHFKVILTISFLEFQTATSSKRRKLFELDVETFASEDVEVTEMALPFVRGHYSVKDSGNNASCTPLTTEMTTN